MDCKVGSGLLLAISVDVECSPAIDWLIRFHELLSVLHEIFAVLFCPGFINAQSEIQGVHFHFTIQLEVLITFWSFQLFDQTCLKKRRLSHFTPWALIVEWELPFLAFQFTFELILPLTHLSAYFQSSLLLAPFLSVFSQDTLHKSPQLISNPQLSYLRPCSQTKVVFQRVITYIRTVQVLFFSCTLVPV